MSMMNAAVFAGPGRIVLGRKPNPVAGPGEAVSKVTMTTICGTGVHILEGEYPVKQGLTIGHEPVVTTLCPGGKERMRRLMRVVASRRVNLGPLVTHRFRLEEIEPADELFANQRDGVLKVAITP